MGILKHTITKAVDTHFDKQVAANVGANTAKQRYYQQQVQQNIQKTPNGQAIANPQLYNQWLANQKRTIDKNDNELLCKKAELITELIKDGKTPEEALEFANKIFN